MTIVDADVARRCLTGDKVIPYGYCHCGCGEKTNLIKWTYAKRGYVQGEPHRYIAGHQTRLSAVEIIETPDTNCWEWQRYRSPLGYGRTTVAGRKRVAHQVYYEALVGPIPDGLELDHLCRNPPCVNPGHLEPVTHRENLLRGNAPNSILHRTGRCKRGHAFSEANTYVDPKTGRRQCRACRRLRQKVARG